MSKPTGQPTGRPRRPCRYCGGLTRDQNGLCCVRTRVRASYAANRERGAERAREARKANPEVNRRAGLKWRRNNPELRMWSAARSRALRRGITFTITVDEVVIPASCPIFGTPIVSGHGRGRGHLDESPSIDRIDNNLGYVPGNVAVVSGRANKIKNAGNAAEHRRIAEWIESFSK